MATGEADLTRNGEVVLVTGGTDGIGKATAKLFASQGATVVVWGRNEERLAAAQQIPNIIADRVDVTDSADVLRGMRRVADLGPLAVGVHAAGAAKANDLTKMTYEKREAAWADTRELNLDGAISVGHAALTLLEKGKLKEGGTLAFITTQLASDSSDLVAARMSAHFAAAKAGVERFAGALATILGPHDITANSVAPGWVPGTGSTREMAAFDQHFAEQAPTGKLTTPEQIAGTVAFLASPAGHAFTGQVLHPSQGVYGG